MPRFKLIALLLAVTVVAACGPDREPQAGAARGPGAGAAAQPGPAPAQERAHEGVLDDEEVVRRVFVAAADGDDSALPGRLTARVSVVRVGVVALHDQLLARREPTPSRAAVLAALDALSALDGGVDAGALPPLVATWRGWTDEQAAVETELARLLSLANAGLSLPSLPGAAGLHDIVTKAAEHGPPPPASVAAAGIALVRYAALAIGEEGDESTSAQAEALAAARAAFDALSWPGGLALMAEPVAERLLERDPASLRGTVLWTIAADGYMASGDPLRSGMMYVQRARATWRGDADMAAVRRAVLLAETGRRRVEESGAGGRELFEACSVHAYALQAAGQHEDAVAACDAGLAVAGAGTPEETALLHRVSAVSLFRLGRHEDSLTECRRALAVLGPDFVPDEDDARGLVPGIEELAAQACLELGRHGPAIAFLESVAAFHQREAGKPWASAQQRTEALLLRARVIARTGDKTAARAAVREILEAGGQGTRQLAFAADVLLEAGFVEDADQIVAQGEEALGPERAALFGELRGRIDAARGDMDGARVAFRAAIDLVTGGDTTRKSLGAARILESWARAEEAAGDRARAAELFQTAANHLVDVGMDGEMRRLLDEVRRVQ